MRLVGEVATISGFGEAMYLLVGEVVVTVIGGFGDAMYLLVGDPDM